MNRKQSPVCNGYTCINDLSSHTDMMHRNSDMAMVLSKFEMAEWTKTVKGDILA